MPSPTTTLSPSQLARDLGVRDLTDPDQGRHAIQLLVDAAVASLATAWNCQVHWQRRPRVVPVEDNYDRLRIPPDAVSRDVRYTRYVGRRRMLRSHSTAMIPAALRAVAAEPVDDVVLVCPGVVYRRDAIDRLHAPTPHQLDLWRITRRPLAHADLREMVDLLVEALAPGRPWRWEPRVHPYTLDGRQVDVCWDGEWVEVAECGLAHPEVLERAGLAGWSGLAIGMGLDLRDRVYAALHQESVHQWAARSPRQGGRYPSAHAVEVEGREMTGEAVACTTEQALLGEGPRWDARRGELLWVDILAGRVYRERVADDGALLPVASYQVPGTVGAVAPVQDDPGWLLAAGRGFAHLSVDGTVRQLAEEVAPAGTRMNDAACDPQGRFWAGTKADAAGAAALYRFDGNGRTEVVLEGLTISNGLGWSLDSATMYLADSHPGVIHAFAFDADQGRISGGRVLVELPEEVGVPDGLTVDADGDLWVAIWGGGRVHRYAPDGELRQTLAVPADQSTSCAFAGPGLQRLYVTTATEDWSEEQRRADPLAGLVYRFDTDATGRPAAPFRPDPTWWARRTRRPAPG